MAKKKSKAGRKKKAIEEKLVYIQGYVKLQEKLDFFQATEEQGSSPSVEIRKFVVGFNRKHFKGK